MIGAGLVAKKAVRKGAAGQAYVKTSLAPGSRAVTDYLDDAGLTPYLEKLNFNLVGYGCTTCIGNSGPLPEPVATAIHRQQHDRGGGAQAATATSKGACIRRCAPTISPRRRWSWPTRSPARSISISIKSRWATARMGKPVYLRDIWPILRRRSPQLVEKSVSAQVFSRSYGDVFTGDENWRSLPVADR